MIERVDFLNMLEAARNLRLIKVVTGMRRCGKSTLLAQFQQKLIAEGVESENIISLNFEDLAHADLLDYNTLYKYVCERIKKGAKTYIFLDEIQLVHQWERVVNSLFLNPDLDIYLTGSNAYMLSGELATLLSGRYVEINVLPLSFKEYFGHIKASRGFPIGFPFGFAPDKRQAFYKYIASSGLAQTVDIDNDEVMRSVLGSIVDTVIVKDIMQRRKISDVATLKKLVHFLADNISNPLSCNRIANILTDSGTKITAPTVESYLQALCESFVVYRAARFDLRGNEILKTLGKYYVCDLGIRNYMLAKSADLGRVIENVVFLELKRRNYEVFVGKLEPYEIDFIVKKNNQTLYIQVAASAMEQQTLARELRPLKLIKDNYPKILLTLDDYTANFEGIQKLNLIDWLLQ